MVPSALLTHTQATIFVLVDSSLSNSSINNSPELFIGVTFRMAPFSSQIICHGTILLWCSMVVIKTSSPAFKLALPQVCATKFMLSVTPLVKIHSASSLAFINCCMVLRVASKYSVDLAANVCAAL